MAKKLQFNIALGNKTFYTLISILAVIIVGGIVIAVVPEWTEKSVSHEASNIKVEIDGKFYDLQTAIDYRFVVTEEPPDCQVVYPYNSAQEASTNDVIIDLPDICRNGNTCKLIWTIYRAGKVVRAEQITFTQNTDNTWTSSSPAYSSKGTNGGSDQWIYYAWNAWLADDFLLAGENNAAKITYVDNTAYAAELQVCRTA